jgi:taurine dioxygenase
LWKRHDCVGDQTAVQPRPHDLVFWDNRSLMHLAAGCPPDQRRKLYRTTIEGDISF